MRFLIKVYPEGTMSKHMGELKVGESIEMKGPIMKIEYKPNMKKKIGMIAGARSGTLCTVRMQAAQNVHAIAAVDVMLNSNCCAHHGSILQRLGSPRFSRATCQQAGQVLQAVPE